MVTAATDGPEGAALGRELGFPVAIVRSARATRMAMKVDPATRGVKVSAPAALPVAAVAAFVRAHAGWARARVGRLPPARPFAPGVSLPVLGVERVIAQDAASRFPARLDDGPDGPRILVGRTEFVASRVESLLKDVARRHIEAAARGKAAAVGRRVASVSVRDTVSRWGSCSSRGDLSFSWRLVFAPLDIVDYVVAHEVAHLLEMNHGPKFWKACAALSGVKPPHARAWLARHGAALHGYGG